jgi:hypothetical protein
VVGALIGKGLDRGKGGRGRTGGKENYETHRDCQQADRYQQSPSLGATSFGLTPFLGCDELLLRVSTSPTTRHAAP